MDMTKTGQLIAGRRMALGMTQSDLARSLGVTDKAVSKWERGKSFPDIALLNRLAVELRLSIVEILDGEIQDAARSSNLERAECCYEQQNYAMPLSLSWQEAGDLVSPCLFGSNLEHTRSCIHNGLSAQMLRNRKFVGKPSACRGCAVEWYPVGERTLFYFDVPYTRHFSEGYHMKRAHECNSLSVMNPCAEQEAGIGQHELFLQKGKTYEFAVVAWAKEPATLIVSLTSRNGGQVYACREIRIEGEDWVRCEAVLQSGADDPDADLRITIKGEGSICFGAVSLMPEGHFRGMRRDVVDLLREMGVSILRWPGGNFAGEYCWMDGLMPVDMRAPFESYQGIETQPHSMGYDFHEINTDDFVALCREIGAQPFITINPAWNTPQENAAWVEYCNGDADSEYGKLRAQRGYVQPYHVQLWSLGNEAGYGHMEGDNTPGGYCRIAMENGKKMLEISPYLSLCSSGPYPSQEWAEMCARPLSTIAPLVSLHHYGRVPKYTEKSLIKEEYYACLASVNRMRSLAHKLRGMLDEQVKISFDEWNVWYSWYRPSGVTEGIYAALALHMLMCEAKKCGITLACHFEAVNEGMIQVWPDGAALTAQGQVFAAMKRHAAGKLCYTSPDAVATADKEGRVTATIINASLDENKEIFFGGCGRCVEAVLYESDTVLHPSVFDMRNVLSETGGNKFSMPPHSLLLLVFSAE